MFKNHGPGGCCCGGNGGFGCLVCSDQFTQRTNPSDIGDCVAVVNYEVGIGEDCLKPIAATPSCSIQLPTPRTPANRAGSGTQTLYLGLLGNQGFGLPLRNSRYYELDISPVDGNSFFIISTEPIYTRGFNSSWSHNDIGIGRGKVGIYRHVPDLTGTGQGATRVFDWSGSWNLSSNNDGYAYDEPSFYWEENMIVRIEIATIHQGFDVDTSSTPGDFVALDHTNCMRVYINDSLVAQTGLFDAILEDIYINKAPLQQGLHLRTPESVWYYQDGQEYKYHGQPTGIKLNSFKSYDDYGSSACYDKGGAPFQLAGYCPRNESVVDLAGLYPNPPEAFDDCAYTKPAYFFWGMGDELPPSNIDVTFSGAGISYDNGDTDTIADQTYTLYRNGLPGSQKPNSNYIIQSLQNRWFYSRQWAEGTGPLITQDPGPVIFEKRIRSFFLWPIYCDWVYPLEGGFPTAAYFGKTCPPMTLLGIYETEIGPFGGPWTVVRHDRLNSYAIQMSNITEPQGSVVLSPWYQRVYAGGGTDNTTGTVTLQF